MVNIEFLVISYFVSLFVDWVFQYDWQATNKSKWGKNDDKYLSFAGLLSHSYTYACLTAFISFIILNPYKTDNRVFIVLILLFITHAIIDTRIPVKAIMKLKGMSNEQINDYANYGFMHIGIDHRLHELVLVLIAIFIM